MEDKTFASRLCDLMNAKGLSRASLARKIDITPVTVGEYMRGKTQPKATTLAKIAKVFNVESDFLLGLQIDKPDEKDVCNLALKHYGAAAQTRMVFEECAELQKELCKNARGADNKYHIAEEIADVEIVLAQMKLLFDIEDSVFSYKTQKLQRLRNRICAELDKGR